MSIFEESVEFLDSDIRFHDSRRFELKMDIELERRRKSVYEIETYFFIPSALNINARTYRKSEFFNNLQNFVRFKTPSMSLSKICDPSFGNSPYNKIKAAVQRVFEGAVSGEDIASLFSEIKLLGCVSKDYIKEYNALFIRELKKEKGRRDSAGLRENLAAFLEELGGFKKKMAALKMDIINPAVPERVRNAFMFFEEYFSIVCEENLVSMLYSIEKAGCRGFFSREAEKLAGMIKSENDFRRENGYPSIIMEGERNEIFTYRRGVLKKFISSVLYLKTKISEWEGVSQLFFGIAAGIAMLFAVTVTIYAQKKYQINSVPFIVIIVVSYIFKDRIKDWLKLWFSRSMTNWLSDRRLSIVDPSSGEKIGMLKDAFSFIHSDSVPPDIARLRNRDNITSADEDGKPEKIFKYEKTVKIFSGKIFRHHNVRKDINDIMRFNVHRFLINADDPYEKQKYLDFKTGEIKETECARVYHVNVLIKYIYRLAGNLVINYDRIRLILNRDGIVRIENVKV